MKIFFLDDLPAFVSKEVHEHFYNYFSLATSPKDADIVVTGVSKIDLTGLPNLKYIVCNATNTMHIKHDISTKIISLKEHTDMLRHITSTGELTIMLMLELLRHTNITTSNIFDMIRPNVPGKTLANKKVAVVGMGRIGRQVFGILRAFNADPRAFDVNDKPDFSLFDIITLHCSVDETTKPILNKKEFEIIKDGTYIINTSRGQAIDEAELLKNIPRLGGFAGDVLGDILTREEIVLLYNKPNVILTPHIGGYTIEDMKATSLFCYNLLMEEIKKC